MSCIIYFRPTFRMFLWLLLVARVTAYPRGAPNSQVWIGKEISSRNVMYRVALSALLLCIAWSWFSVSTWSQDMGWRHRTITGAPTLSRLLPNPLYSLLLTSPIPAPCSLLITSLLPAGGPATGASLFPCRPIARCQPADLQGIYCPGQGSSCPVSFCQVRKFILSSRFESSHLVSSRFVSSRLVSFLPCVF